MARINTQLAGLEFRNPLLPSNGPIVRDGDSIINIANNGAGGLISETVSTEPCETPRPNLAKLEEGMLMADSWSQIPPEEWLEEEYPKALEMDLPLIASIGRTPSDVEELAKDVADVGVDALQLVIDYPMDDPSPLLESVKTAKKDTDIPIFVQVDCKTLDLENCAEELEKAGADGIVAIKPIGPAISINVNIERPVLGSAKGYGWLAGPAVKPLAIRAVADIAQTVDIPVIGAGGIKDERDVVEYIMAGASAVTIGSAAIVRGSKIFGIIADNLQRFMNSRGYENIEDLRGVALRNISDEPIRTTSKQPDIITPKCTGCGLCVKHCPYDAIKIVGGKARINSASCVGCGLCVSVCPPNALRF
ncbi:MAG: 4Fe-4S binding protein [Candidatus Hadarchaeia archaeon]